MGSERRTGGGALVRGAFRAGLWMAVGIGAAATFVWFGSGQAPLPPEDHQVVSVGPAPGGTRQDRPHPARDLRSMAEPLWRTVDAGELTWSAPRVGVRHRRGRRRAVAPSQRLHGGVRE